MTLFLHDSFQSTYDRLSASLPQAVLLTGPHGVGLRTIARSIAAKNLIAELRPTNTDGAIDDATGSIKIETVRDLAQTSRGKSGREEVIVIDNADMMTIQAQNAFLKLLEEPRPGLHFILTAHQPDRLLTTIKSRASRISVPVVEASKDVAMVDEFNLQNDRAQALFIASGLPAELTRLGQNSDYFASQQALFRKARDFLQAKPYQRVVTLQTFKEREAAMAFCDAALKILLRAPDTNTVKLADALLAARDIIATTNATPRLQLLAAVV